MNRGRGRRSFDNNRRVDHRFQNAGRGSPKPRRGNFNQNRPNTDNTSSNTQTKETPKKEEMQKTTQEVKRERSRSPIDRKECKEENVNAGASNQQSNETSHVKYTGRPGEKKFNSRCRLFIANLPTTMAEDDLTALFEPYGETKEAYFNKDKGFGFIRMDYRINAEAAKSVLDKKVHKGRSIQVRFATHASAIELHGLDQYASNELVKDAMSQFGVVEKAVIVCDERGKSKGYAIIEFEWKKAAQKALERLKDEMFVLGRLPKPVFAKPLTQNDEEDGITEASLERLNGLKEERDFNPRFIPPNSYEYQLAQKWKDLYLEEQEKKTRLERELEDARYKVELEMEASSREQDAMRIREELARRQEELRQIEEDMLQKRQIVFGNRPTNLSNGNNFDNRGPPPRGPMGPAGGNSNFRPNIIRPGNDQVNMSRNPGVSVLGPRPQNGPGILQQNLGQGMQHGMLPRLPPPPGIPGMRPPMMQGGPGGPGRDMPPRGGEQRFRPRRN